MTTACGMQGLDTKVRSLTIELGQRDDTITKFQKEKKVLEELQQVRTYHMFFPPYSTNCAILNHTNVCFHLQKTLDDLQAEEDKVNHLTKTNSKLTTQVHEVSSGTQTTKT